MMCVTEQVIVWYFFLNKQQHNGFCHLSMHFFAWTGVHSLLNFVIDLSSGRFYLLFLPFPSLLVWNLIILKAIGSPQEASVHVTLVVNTFHPLLCFLVLSFKLHLNLHLSTQRYKILQRLLVMLFFLQELDFEPSVSLLSSIAESFQLVCLAVMLGWVKLSQGMVEPALRLSDPLAAFLSSFRLWPAVSRSHGSAGDCGRAESCGSANISNWWQGDGGLGCSLVWFLFRSQIFLPQWGTPLLQRHEECKVKVEPAACPVFWTSSAK